MSKEVKVLVHVDSVDDLMHYHHPLEQLDAEGRVQLRELRWIPGRPDGDLDDDLEQSVVRFCRPAYESRRRPRDDEDEARGGGRRRGIEFLDGVPRWFSNQRRSGGDDRNQGRSEGRHRGEPPSWRRRLVDNDSRSPPWFSS
jgi:hypothetical protein